MNTSRKGSRKELQCLEEFQRYMKKEEPAMPLKIAWKTYRSRKGGNDFLGDASQNITGFDLAFLYDFKNPYKDRKLILIQVDDKFEQKRWDSLKENWGNMCPETIESYYAVYAHKPKIFDESDNNIELPGFWLLLV